MIRTTLMIGLGAGALLAMSIRPAHKAPRATQAAPRLASESGMLDWLIQDVCTDTADRAVSGDPVACARHRDVRVGEPLPYLLTDWDHSKGRSLGATSSIPVKGRDGTLMVLVSKQLGGNFDQDSSFSFAPQRDAFDLIDVAHSAYASIVRTFDGGCFDQLLSHNGSTRSAKDRAGGWILFPLTGLPKQWPASQAARVTTWRIQLTKAAAKCSTNHAAGLTVWSRPATYTFETGKMLIAIKSDHFASEDLSQAENSFERTYFTRQYGMTRWEAWWTLAHCRSVLGTRSPRCTAGSSPLNARCSVLRIAGDLAPGLEVHGAQSWIRMDCRDMSRVVQLRTAQLPLSPAMAASGGVVDIDYQATVAAFRRR